MAGHFQEAALFFSPFRLTANEISRVLCLNPASYGLKRLQEFRLRGWTDVEKAPAFSLKLFALRGEQQEMVGAFNGTFRFEGGAKSIETLHFHTAPSWKGSGFADAVLLRALDAFESCGISYARTGELDGKLSFFRERGWKLTQPAPNAKGNIAVIDFTDRPHINDMRQRLTQKIVALQS